MVHGQVCCYLPYSSLCQPYVYPPWCLIPLRIPLSVPLPLLYALTHQSLLASPALPPTRSGEAWIQGPFTSPFNSSLGYGRLLLVVTGIGLSAALPIVQQLMCSEREVFLVWITRSKEHISFMLPLLLKCTSTIIFYDGDQSMDDVQSGLDDSSRHVRVYVGRPRLDKIIDWIVMFKHGTLARKLQPPPLSHEAGSLAHRVRRRSNEMLGWATRPSKEVLAAPVEQATQLTLPEDAATFYSCDATPLLEALPAHDRSSWALLYCGNVPPVKQAVRLSSKRWGFLYSEESFAW